MNLENLHEAKVFYSQLINNIDKEWNRLYREKSEREDKERKRKCEELENLTKVKIKSLRPKEENLFDNIAYKVWENLELFYKRAPKIQTIGCNLNLCDYDCRTPHYITTMEEGNYTYTIEDTSQCPVFNSITSSLIFRENNLDDPIYTFFDQSRYRLVCKRIYDMKSVTYSLSIQKLE